MTGMRFYLNDPVTGRIARDAVGRWFRFPTHEAASEYARLQWPRGYTVGEVIDWDGETITAIDKGE